MLSSSDLRTLVLKSLIFFFFPSSSTLLGYSYLTIYNVKVTRPSFCVGGYHPTLKLSGIPTFTFIVSLTHGMDNI